MIKKIKINFKNVGKEKVEVKIIGAGFFRQSGSLRYKHYMWQRDRAIILWENLKTIYTGIVL